MSRPAKSRADKAKGDKPASHEIIPGKFTENDWQWMVDRDDGEEFAAQIIDEIVGAATQVVYTRWTDQNLYPYTVHTCQEVLLQMMDWYFLDYDQGEPDIATDLLWQEDTEPEPCRRECLSEGLVPKTTIIAPVIEETTVQAFSTLMPHISEREGADDGVQDEQRPEPEPTAEEQASAESAAGPPAPPGVSPRTPLANSLAVARERARGGKRAPLPPVPRTPRRKPAPTRPLAMPAGGSDRGSDSERAHFEQFVREMEAQGFSPAAVAGQLLAQQQPPFFAPPLPPQATSHKLGKAPTGDGLYDEQGNQITFAKFDPDRLPARTIKVGYQLVDPQVIAARRRLELLQKGQPLDDTDEKESGADEGFATGASAGGAATASNGATAGGPKEKKAGKAGGAVRKTLDPPKAIIPKLTTRSLAASTGPGDKHHVLERIDPLPPPLIETIGVSAGVTVKEGDRIKKGHPLASNKLEKLSEEQLLSLRPVRVRGAAGTATGALYTLDPTASSYASPMALPPGAIAAAGTGGHLQQQVFETPIAPAQFAPLGAAFEQDAR